MEEDIRGKLDLITGASSSLDMTAITDLFSDHRVVTTTPANMADYNVMSGDPLTISANFGSGYEMEDGSIVSGRAQLQITDVVFSDTQLGAHVTAIFTDVTKDGAPLASGEFTGSIALTSAADDSLTITGDLAFNNLTIQGRQQNGAITISGGLDGGIDLDDLSSLSGNLRLNFSRFISGDHTVNAGSFVNVAFGALGTTLTANLETNTGPVDVNLSVTPGATEGSTLLHTLSPGRVGPYTVSVNDLVYGDSCSGSVSFADTASGQTAEVFINEECNGYTYSER